MTPLVIIGAGGFGRECHDIVVAMNAVTQTWDFLGFIDDSEPDAALLARRGARWLGGATELPRMSGVAFVVGIGDPTARRGLARAASDAGLTAATLIHPSATLGLDVEVSPGTVICSHASLTTNIRIGGHAQLDQNVAVGHDVSVGAFARVNPGATISGAVALGDGVVVGTNAAVIQGISIGPGAIVGAGAVVLHDVPGGITVAGVPASRINGAPVWE